MHISAAWVGDVPSEPLTMKVFNSNGSPRNLMGYTKFVVRMIDPDNREVDLTGSLLETAQASSGRLVFRWPTDRSLFDQPGEYLVQVELYGPNGTRDSTTAHTIKVQRLGGVY